MYFSAGTALGMDARLIFDTSALIDLEQDAQRRYGFKRSHTFLDTLQQVTGASFILPREVREELEIHYKHHLVSGRPEISSHTFSKIERMPTADEELETYLASQQEEVDNVQYFTRLLQQRYCNGKKATLDPISPADWSVIDTALLWGMFAKNTYTKNLATASTTPFQGVPRVAVLSSDYHIYWTLERAFEESECVELGSHLKPFNVRLYDLVGGDQCMR